MTVKKVLSDCLIKLNQTDFSDEATYTAEQQALADKLVECLNIVWRGVCASYLPQFHDETVTLENGSLDYDALEYAFSYPVRLMKGDERHPIRTYPTCLKSDFSGQGTLTYAYLPSLPLMLTDEVPDVRLNSAVLSDGVLGEYWFENKVFDLAASYDTAFRTALSQLRYKGRDMRIKTGRWQA